ncbi:hypothetical protein F4821DRAFT_262853 [Hypoxylon rubiginosum]|uniref:Uncharacterized protein n=1 Tax=Hypoxylon rubiginosum TaxID=110542 RepID=A0ACC0CSS1_9PEZI|nr:hypothetical protein F4821DRAFT_262853 [Hypoxylon rubiginosum]
MVNTMKLISIVLSGALPTVFAGDLYAINHCSFDVWCWGAKNDGTDSPVELTTANGGIYKSPLRANNDNMGSVVKCSMNSDRSQPFQMELAVQNGRSWFDLSAIDGDPFLPFTRHGDVSGQCVLHCDPGSSSCEYPVQVDCETQEDAWLALY